MTLALVGAGLLFSFTPGMAEALEYDRGTVESGQLWRLLTGQLVHWTARMTFLDLGVILLLGIWLEIRSRRLLIAALTGATCLIALGLHFLSHDLDSYRGSSGLAASLFVCAALILLGDRKLHWTWRSLALLALLLLTAKIIWELWSGTALAAGELPHGVRVTPLVHLLGALSGVVAFLLNCRSIPPRH